MKPAARPARSEIGNDRRNPVRVADDAAAREEARRMGRPRYARTSDTTRPAAPDRGPGPPIVDTGRIGRGTRNVRLASYLDPTAVPSI